MAPWRYIPAATLLLVSLLTVGCNPPAENPAWRYHHGYVLMLPGVEGGTWMFANTIKGLRDAGIANAIEAVEWGERPFHSIPNLIDEPANRRRAEIIAATLADVRQHYPESPLTLIGYSGGGGLAAFVAETLPGELMLDRIILIAPALAPEYDLCPTLSRARLGVVSFSSELDLFILGFGTSIHGTMDRKQTEAAGKVGFQTEAWPCDAEMLEQIFWKQEWIWLGHDGTHDGWLTRAWVREVLADYIPTCEPAGDDAPSRTEPMRLAPLKAG